MQSYVHAELAGGTVGRPVSRRSILAQAVSAALITGAFSQAAVGQELEEIVVTATKRAESVMDVPIAVQALSGDFMRDVNLDDVKDLVSFTPGVTGNSKDSFLDAIRVRGIVTNDFGNGGDPSIGVYKNGFYQGRNGAAVTSLYDLDRAEILRGPQGFLFGRNAISGALNTFTTKPSTDDRNGYVDIRAGERGVLRGEGGFNVALGENVAVRFAGLHSEEDGYVRNVLTGEDYIRHDKTAVRVTGRYDAGGKLTADLYLEYEDREQSGTIYRATGGAGSYALLESIYGDLGLPDDPRNVNIDEPENGIIDNGEVGTIGLELNYDLDWATLTSLTGYKDHDYHYTEDFDGTNLLIFNYEQAQSGTYVEQELRLTSDTDGMFSWYAGASYYREEIDSQFLGQQDEDLYCTIYWGNTCQDLWDFYNNAYGGAYAYLLNDYFGSYTWTPSPTGNMDDWNETQGVFEGWAAYVDLNFRLNDLWDVSLGVRYNEDQKRMSQQVLTALNPSPVLGNRVQTGFTTPEGPITGSRTWREPTYRAVANFRPVDNHLLYASITTGYKQGGYNSFKASPDGPFGSHVALPGTHEPGSFEGENVVSYELGYKGTIMDGRSQLQLNVFQYYYEDLQSTCNIPGQPGVIVCNVGEVDAVGFEGVWNFALNEYLTFGTGIAYFDSEATGIQAFCDEGERILGDINACEGQSLPGAPEWTAYATTNFEFPAPGGNWFGNLSWSWEDSTRTGFLPLTPATTTFPEGGRLVNDFNEVQLLAGYAAEAGWSLALYVENLTDDVYYDSGGSGGNPTNPYVQTDISPSRPRTAGLRFIYGF